MSELFTDAAIPSPEWRRIPGWNGGTCGARHIHRSGVEVRHCGHPTALRPYFIPGRLHDLGTFRLLAQAKTAALAAQPGE